MQVQYSALGCSGPDSYCLCNNVNFGYGLRDCANGACGTAVASTVIAYGSAYCSTAFATHTATSTGFAALPSCGQTCFKHEGSVFDAGLLESGSPLPVQESELWLWTEGLRKWRMRHRRRLDGHCIWVFVLCLSYGL